MCVRECACVRPGQKWGRLSLIYADGACVGITVCACVGQRGSLYTTGLSTHPRVLYTPVLSTLLTSLPSTHLSALYTHILLSV